MGDHQAARAAFAGFRLGDLRRRRVDAGAHPFHHRPDPEGDRPAAGRASDLRRRRARRDRRHRRPLSRDRRPPHRGAARRSARRHRHAPMPHPSRRLPDLGRSRRRHQAAHRRYRSVGLRLSGEASGKPRLRRRHRHARRPRSTPAPTAPSPRCSSTTTSTSLPRPGSRPRHHDPDRARHHADAQFQAGAQFRHPRRHQRAGLAGGKNSTGSTTMPRPASWWPPRLPPARCRNSPSTASIPFISTP